VGRSSLSILDKNLNLLANTQAREGAVWIQDNHVLVMGTFNPTDMNIGYLMVLPDSVGKPTEILIQNLHRPVHFELGDLDGDGLEVSLICEYGRNIGALTWWQKSSTGNYRKNVLRNMPGATKAYIRDLNQDGKPAVIALFGQGDEGIYIYINQGEG